MECIVDHFDLDDLEREYYGECPRPITWSELDSMRDLAAHYMRNGTRKEMLLAHRLAHAAAWIRAEVKALGQQEQRVLQIDTVA